MLSREYLVSIFKAKIIDFGSANNCILSGSRLKNEPHFFISNNNEIISYSDVDFLFIGNQDVRNDLPKSMTLIMEGYTLKLNKISYKNIQYDVGKCISLAINGNNYEKVFIFWTYIALLELWAHIHGSKLSALKKQYVFNKFILTLLLNFPNFIENENMDYCTITKYYGCVFNDTMTGDKLYNVKTGNHGRKTILSTIQYCCMIDTIFSFLEDRYNFDEDLLYIRSLITANPRNAIQHMSSIIPIIEKYYYDNNSEKVLQYQLQKLYLLDTL